MTVETKVALTEQDVRSYSAKMNEADWMADFRADALVKAEQLPMPKPDKTKIDKWNFHRIPCPYGREYCVCFIGRAF